VRLKLDLFVAAQKTKREIMLVFGAEMCTANRDLLSLSAKTRILQLRSRQNRPPKQWAIHLGHLYSTEAILIAALGNLWSLA
jgi:hypothetical protein